MNSFLFQTGYLTIRSVFQPEDDDEQTFELDFPNFELLRSLFERLLADIIHKNITDIREISSKLRSCLKNNEPDHFFK